MTKKRFTMKGSTILECGEEITAWDCCDLLNEQHEENKKLKSVNQDHKDHLGDFYADYDRLEKENEQCKMMIATLRNIILENGIDFE